MMLYYFLDFSEWNGVKGYVGEYGVFVVLVVVVTVFCIRVNTFYCVEV